MRKTPRGWIQIGESRTRGVARIPLGLKPSRDSRATSQRDSPIWIQPLGVFRYKIYDKLSCGQAKFPRILSQNGQNDLEGQGQWPLFSIPTESIPWCMFGANLVIPTQICDELSCGQGKVYGRTVGQTDRRRQRQYPFGLKGQRVKTEYLERMIGMKANTNITSTLTQHRHGGCITYKHRILNDITMSTICLINDWQQLTHWDVRIWLHLKWCVCECQSPRERGVAMFPILIMIFIFLFNEWNANGLLQNRLQYFVNPLRFRISRTNPSMKNLHY